MGAILDVIVTLKSARITICLFLILYSKFLIGNAQNASIVTAGGIQPSYLSLVLPPRRWEMEDRLVCTALRVQVRPSDPEATESHPPPAAPSAQLPGDVESSQEAV